MEEGLISFVVSRNMGDCIYCLPFCRSVAQTEGKDKFNLVLVINFPASYSKCEMYENSKHPCGNVTMTRGMADMLIPLLKVQSYVSSVSVVDYNDKDSFATIKRPFVLDNFIKLGLNLAAGSITRWYQDLCVTNHCIDDWNPWITAPVDTISKDKIVLVRSQRYWGLVNYSILKEYANSILFIGVDEEYKSICRYVGCEIPRYTIKNFLDATCVIAGSKLFIGNQTGLYSIAEGLKVTRLLEQSHGCPNVIPSNNGYACYNKDYFNSMVKFLYERN